MNSLREEEPNINDSDIDEDSDDDESVGQLPKKIKIKKIAPLTRGDEDDDDDDDDMEDDDDVDDDDSNYLSDKDENEDAPLNSKNLLPKFADLDTDDDDEDEEEDENYLQKFDETTKHNIISEFHPEMQAHNYDEVDILSTVIRNEMGIIIDPLHRTLPFITKYEKARILGERAKQLNSGAKAFVEVEPTVIDGYLIALKEYENKKIPFILKRPLPNGGCEYWRMKDLEIL